MSGLALKLVLGAGVVLWFMVCVWIYRVFQGAAWLAGSTVASCLFFLGTTVGASLWVRKALFLLPLWLAIAVLLLLHLREAQRRADCERLAMAATPDVRVLPGPAPSREEQAPYI